MSETTNLKLKKHDEPLNENTNQFNIKDYLNGNWDKIEDFAEQVNDKVIEIEDSIELVKQRTEQLDINKASKAELQEVAIALQAELKATRKDLQAGTLEGEDTGESLYLQDSSDARFREFGIGGNSKQETREGYNILNYLEEMYNTQNGLTMSKDTKTGYITVNGTPTANYTNIKRQTNITNILEVGQTYTLWQEVYGSSANPGVYLQVREVDTENVATNYFIRSEKKTFTVKEGCTYYAQLLTATIEQTGTLTNYKNRYMLYKGTGDKGFELYGAMPSLEFPSEVEAVKDNVNVTVCSKNKLDFSKWNNATASHGTIEQVENEIKLTATANDCYTDTFAYKFQGTLNKDKIEYYGFIAKPNTKYTFSCKVNDTTKSKRLAMFFSDKDYNAISYVTTATSVLTATTPENCKYITIRVGVTNAGDSLTFTDLQVEEGEATDYIAHEEQTFTMPVQQEMLEGDKFEKVNGVWKEKHTWGKLELTGNETGWFKSSTTMTNAYGIKNEKIGLPVLTENTSKCTHFKYADGVTATSTSKYISQLENLYLSFPLDIAKTLEEFKSLMQEQVDAETPVTIYYKLETPTKLPFTEAQKAVAKQIRQTLHSYKGGTHVYCTDEISPIFNVKYTIDQKAYIQAEIEKIAKGVINNV